MSSLSVGILKCGTGPSVDALSIRSPDSFVLKEFNSIKTSIKIGNFKI